MNFIFKYMILYSNVAYAIKLQVCSKLLIKKIQK